LEEELRLVFEAEQKAKGILSQAEDKVEQSKVEARSEAEVIISNSEKEARKNGEKLISERLAEADAKGEELKALQEAKISEMDRVASSKMREAVDLIMRSIIQEN
jgi:vacuolar-type H+-ATPase subunit H